MIRLQAGELACEIAPGLGGCIAGLWQGTAHPLARNNRTVQSHASTAIEPVSHGDNAMNLVAAGGHPAEPGLTILQPGESCGAELTIEAERMP